MQLTAFVCLALALSASAIPVQNSSGRKGVAAGGPAKGAAAGTAVGAGLTGKGSSFVAAANSTGVAANSTAAANATAASTAAAASSTDLQSSLTLDPSVIAPGFAQNGQAVAEPGQVASLTSTNNFINFCATVPGVPLTNGLQISTGSCNPAPMGIIAGQADMPSAKFVFPPNGATIQSNQAFTITMAVNKLITGNFVNADESYFAAPQQTDPTTNQVLGHSHVVIEKLDSLAQTTPTNPTDFVFFKGLNAAAVNGQLSTPVASGLPAGAYRLASINTAANHQPVLVAVAQHGSLDDMVYFTVSDNAAAANSTAAAAPTVSSSVAKSAAGSVSSTAVPPPVPVASKSAVAASAASAPASAAAVDSKNAPAPASAAIAGTATPASALASKAPAKGPAKLAA